MAQTSTEISRLKLNHPDEFHDGGDVAPGVLHGKIATIYKKIGDNLGTRFFSSDALADSGSVNLVHNYNCGFSQLSPVLYSRNTTTGELTRLDETTTPKRSQFSIAAGTAPLTDIQVTNNSGAARDIALIVNHDGGEGQLSFSIINNQASQLDLSQLLFSSSQYKAAILPFDLHRESSTANLDEVGKIYISYDSINSLWKIAATSNIDNGGVSFFISAAGQISYTSNLVSGTAYSGTLRIGKIDYINS